MVLSLNLLRLFFPVDVTGNLIMIEKLVLGGIWTGDLPIFNPDTLTSAPLRQANIQQQLENDDIGNTLNLKDMPWTHLRRGLWRFINGCCRCHFCQHENMDANCFE